MFAPNVICVLVLNHVLKAELWPFMSTHAIFLLSGSVMKDHENRADIFCRLQVAGCRLKNELLSLSFLHRTPDSLHSTPVSLDQFRLLAVSLYIGVYSTSIGLNSSLQPATCN